MYYAEFCKYGVNTRYESLNGGAYRFYAFETKALRDAFVRDALMANEIDSSTMRWLAGRKFKLINCDVVGAHEVEFDRDRLNPYSNKCVLDRWYYIAWLDARLFFCVKILGGAQEEKRKGYIIIIDTVVI